VLKRKFYAAMPDVALSTAGAHISMATSSDDDYPPENILDG